MNCPAYPVYKESGVQWLGKVPGHWEVKKIKQLFRCIGGGTPSKANASFWEGDIPWVSPKDMHEKTISDTEDHISENAIIESATQMVPAGATLIVVRSGILKHTLPVATNLIPVALNQDMKALVSNGAIKNVKIDQLVAKVEAAIARLQEYRTALITAAVTGKIDVRDTSTENAA